MTSWTCGPTDGGVNTHGEMSSSCATPTTSSWASNTGTTPNGSGENCGNVWAQFNLELHPEKTRLIEFGRFAAERRQRRAQGKPATFDLLGFTHICSKTRNGKFTVRRKTIAQTATQETASSQRHAAAAPALAYSAAGRLAEKRAVGALSILCCASQWQSAHGMPRYHHALLVSDAAPAQSAPPDDMAAHVCTRRAMAAQTPYPASVSRATLVRHDPRQEPGAVVPHAGICAGGAG